MMPDQPKATPSSEPAEGLAQPAPAAKFKAPARRVQRSTLMVVLIVVVLLVVVVGGFVWMISAGATGVVRDIFIIVMAIESVLIGVLLVALVFQLIALTRMLRDEIKPLLENVQETLNVTRGTTRFLGENLVRPVIGVAGTAAGVRRVVSMVGGLVRPRRRSQNRNKRSST